MKLCNALDLFRDTGYLANEFWLFALESSSYYQHVPYMGPYESLSCRELAKPINNFSQGLALQKASSVS